MLSTTSFTLSLILPDSISEYMMVVVVILIMMIRMIMMLFSTKEVF